MLQAKTVLSPSDLSSALGLKALGPGRTKGQNLTAIARGGDGLKVEEVAQEVEVEFAGEKEEEEEGSEEREEEKSVVDRPFWFAITVRRDRRFLFAVEPDTCFRTLVWTSRSWWERWSTLSWRRERRVAEEAAVAVAKTTTTRTRTGEAVAEKEGWKSCLPRPTTTL